jgi:membrane protein implicated in regulation of membrane protease activity
MPSDFGKTLIVIGLILCAVGLAFVLQHKLPGSWLTWLGRIPGDISVERPGFKFYFPLATCLIVSILLTILLSIFRK